jgi:transporter family-2 protein
LAAYRDPVSMDKTLALPLTAFCGGLVAAQAPINGKLGQSVGALPAAAYSFISGGVVLTALALVVGGGFAKFSGAELSWQYYLGGLLGAMYVTSVIITVKYLGAGGVAAATIAGQLSASVLLDHFGALGLDKQPITIARAAGVGLLAAGTYLVVSQP